MTVELFVFPPSPRAVKVLAVANHCGVEYQTRIVDLFKGDQNHPEYIALNPNKRMPVLRDNTFVVWESNAICQYLVGQSRRAELLPDDLRSRALVYQWQCWELAHWVPMIGIFIEENVKKSLRGERPSVAEVEKAEHLFHIHAPILDSHLRDRPFLAGDDLTVADFSIGVWLDGADLAKYPLERYEHLRRWHATLGALPSWKHARAVSQTYLENMLARGRQSA